MAKRSTQATAQAAALPVRDGEDPWTDAEVAEVRAELATAIDKLTADIQASEEHLEELMNDFGDGAGDDEADSGGKQYERDHEIAIANSARNLLREDEEALGRLEDGTFGRCEGCSEPIGKARLQVAPRATLCVPCKTKQERR